MIRRGLGLQQSGTNLGRGGIPLLFFFLQGLVALLQLPVALLLNCQFPLGLGGGNLVAANLSI